MCLCGVFVAEVDDNDCVTVLPSASSILGMSRNFSATSKAVFRLPIGSSYRET